MVCFSLHHGPKTPTFLLLLMEGKRDFSLNRTRSERKINETANVETKKSEEKE